MAPVRFTDAPVHDGLTRPDGRWALAEPVLTAWRAERQRTSLNLGGPLADLREVMNAILYINRTGVPRALPPHDFPPKSTVSAHCKAWTDGGALEQLGVRLRRIVREQVGRKPDPTACAIDAQSVKTAHTVPTATQGHRPRKEDRRKEAERRRRHPRPPPGRRSTPATRSRPSNTAPPRASTSTSSQPPAKAGASR